ncbi:unknown [Bacteroides sp. CAG:754]|nr:unknown [Bacteroides sp. CAG:754]
MQLVSFCEKESFNLVMGNSSLKNIYLCITGVFVIKRIEYEQ